MRKIYIILTYTGTVLSKIIKVYSKDEFSHVSIALDEELNEMYSFGRLNPYNPFIGGFVHEGIDIGTFKRFYKTRAKILCIDVTDEQFEAVKTILKEVEINKEQYKFNVLGMFAVSLNKKRKKEKCFYCAEFIKYVLENAKIDNELPELIRPENFKKVNGGMEIYCGLLRSYNKRKYITQ